MTMDSRLRVALDRAAYALFLVKRMQDVPQRVIDHVREAYDEACKVLDEDFKVEPCVLPEGGRRDECEEALQRIAQWADAYPLDIFPEPTDQQWIEAKVLLKQGGLTLDAISASNMRHVITEVGAMARKALEPQGVNEK